MSYKHRRFDGPKLVVASHNEGKAREIQDFLAPFGFEVISAAALGLIEPEETGASFQDNAELKALAAAKASNLPALADDSGLAVDALGGNPGIYSARWAGPGKDFRPAMKRVLDGLAEEGAKQPGNRSASFVCVMTLAWPDGHTESFEGRIDGKIADRPRGDKGFGYDPIFVPKGHGITFGEMDPVKKHSMSHRAAAFSQLVDACFKK